MGLYLEGHPRQPLRRFMPTVWAWDDLHVPTLPVPQSSFPSLKSKCNIDKHVCISSRFSSQYRPFDASPGLGRGLLLRISPHGRTAGCHGLARGAPL